MLPPIIDPRLDLLLRSLLGRFVKPARGSEVILRNEVPREVVRVFVSFAVAKFRGSGIMGVLKVGRNGNCFAGPNICKGGIDCLDDAVAFVRARDVDGRLGDRYPRLGPPDELGGLKRRVGHHQRHRVSQADVFRGVDDNASGNEARILPGVDHLSQPVKRRVNITAAHRLDERGDGVVVRVLVTIVHYRFFLDAILRNLEGDANGAVIVRRRGQRRDLERVERLARIAVRHPGQVLHHLGCRLAVQVTQAPLPVIERALDQLGGFSQRNWLKLKNL